MKFNPEEIDICCNMFNNKKSTSEVQEYLMNKYLCKRSKTSNFVKYIRKYLGIYESRTNPNYKSV